MTTIISSSISWLMHVTATSIYGSASYSPDTLKQLYLSMVWLHLDYACQIWDPHLVNPEGMSLYSELKIYLRDVLISTFQLKPYIDLYLKCTRRFLKSLIYYSVTRSISQSACICEICFVRRLRGFMIGIPKNGFQVLIQLGEQILRDK